MMFEEFPDAGGLGGDTGGRDMGFRGGNARWRVPFHHRLHQRAQTLLSQNELRRAQKRTSQGHIYSEREKTRI
jgi:hypothetical protein